MDTFDLDLDTSEPESPWRSGGSQRWLAVAVALALIVGLYFVADTRRRESEYRALLEQVRQGQSTLSYANARVTGIASYTSPGNFAELVSPEVRAGLRTLVKDAAGEQVPALQARRESVASLSVVWWHGPQREARDAYVSYLTAQIERMTRISTDLRELYTPRPAGPQLALARRALIALAPDAPSEAEITRILGG
jgi:hypothetical protein